MSIEKTDAYRTSDGKLFENSTEAASHQAKLTISSILQEDPLFGDALGSKIPANDLIEWLEEHRGIVLELLAAREGMNP